MHFDLRICSVGALWAICLVSVISITVGAEAQSEQTNPATRYQPYEDAARDKSLLWSQYLFAPDDSDEAPMFPEVKRAQRYGFGLGKRAVLGLREFGDEYKKRRYNFGLGKRAYDQYSALKSRPHQYNFGLGK